MKNKIKPIIVALIIFCVIFSIMYIKYLKTTEYTITITDKERCVENKDKYVYKVWGEDTQGKMLVFNNEDNLLFLKWNSATIQGELKEDHKYKIKVCGIRVPILSMFENIIEYEEIID